MKNEIILSPNGFPIRWKTGRKEEINENSEVRRWGGNNGGNKDGERKKGWKEEGKVRQEGKRDGKVVER